MPRPKFLETHLKSATKLPDQIWPYHFTPTKHEIRAAATFKRKLGLFNCPHFAICDHRLVELISKGFESSQ